MQQYVANIVTIHIMFLRILHPLLRPHRSLQRAIIINNHARPVRRKAHFRPGICENKDEGLQNANSAVMLSV